MWPLSAALLSLAAIAASAPATSDGGSEVSNISAHGKIGHASNITCIFTPADTSVNWTFNKIPFSTNDTKFKIESERSTQDGNMVYYRRESLIIADTKTDDHGVYGCYLIDNLESEKLATLNLSFPAQLVEQIESPVRVKLGNTTLLTCSFKGFNLTEVKWRISINMSLDKLSSGDMQSVKMNETHINGTLKFASVAKKDNGTYVCGVRDSSSGKMVTTNVNLLVLDKPQINVDFIKGIGMTRIFLNWTINDGNSPIEMYSLQYFKNGSELWTYYSTAVSTENVSFVMKGMEPSTSYKIKMVAKNKEGASNYFESHWIRTLDEDPTFIPAVSVKGFTSTSITIGWNPPPETLSEYVHYYEIRASEKDSPAGTEKEAIHSGDSRNHPYMFDKLKSATLYIFKVRACSEFTGECGQWSAAVNGSTMDGLAGPPIITHISCKTDNISGNNYVSLNWDPPVVINGVISRYNVELTGNASFVNSDGNIETTTWGPKTKYTNSLDKKARFDAMPSNTNFTIKVSGVTRARRSGDPVYVYCTTPPSTPPRDSLQGIRWTKVREGDGRWLFRLNVPRVTERNGAICCYRIFIVRMKNQQKLNDMPSPEHLYISSYKKVHNGKQSAGAYIAEIFTSQTLESDVILGDGITYSTYSADSMKQCSLCATLMSRKVQPNTTTAIPITTTHQPTTIEYENVPTTVQPINIQTESVTVVSKESLDKESDVTTAVEGVSERNEDVDKTSTEKLDPKSHHAKKKKKMKRQDPTHEMLSSGNHRRFDDPGPVRDLSSNLNDDPQRYILDNDFYTNQRIYHQNRNKPYVDTYRSDYTSDLDDSVKGGDISNLEEDDTVISDVDDLTLQSNGDLDKDYSYFQRHKIVSRHVRQVDDFDKKISDFANSDQFKDYSNNLNDGPKPEDVERPPTLKTNENGVIEEIVDRNKIDEKPQDVEIEDFLSIFDGKLDIESNYTGFLELLVHSGEEEKMMPMYSDYFTVLKPGPGASASTDNDLLQTIIMVIVGVLIVLIILLVVLCAIHGHSCRKARQHGVEMHTLQHTLRNIYQGFKGGRHQLVSHSPPDMPPIAKENLIAAYTERQADSGYGFQQEFEVLPDCFPDRTMDASEAKENQGKNRYPDIKAYDQTRVKLTQIDSVVGSDYINANIVMGYKERKKFICAQGPTDVTVDDFWRMIWEYNLELVVMLTNLEEYSKVKCSKYWPDQHQQDKMFNNINVHHTSEKRYSDYIIRELKISKQAISHSNSNNQIIEANGVTKKNGVSECSNGSPSGASEERVVHQYHFLMWKDFVAPEYPYAILKFIKRMNEACPAGRPILVHCSAGVGRTGTLVALDCLLQQLAAENQVAVFNTVCDLRRQRNFLVQSLKQYIFVYRALVEFAQYDDTEIPASRLKSTVDLLRQTAENSDTCMMEEEFERLKQPILEVTKPSAAGRSPEHLAKNRNEAIVPYDHNRVFLAPIATKENSTYINATFIEGYDNAESYIIAQDPLPSTIADFWRMVSEQEISTIVMLSELGEGKCPRYWDDDEIQYDHINVTYLLSESCPYYTRREFQVTNTKNQDRIRVTQLQYHGWPTVSGQVPEVTRGLIELVGQSGVTMSASPPILVHCSQGTDRSSMFVALSILTIQLRTEQRVDVSTVTRKLRCQRMGCLDTFLQYEFLHRAIVNYADLHNLLSDS